MLALCQNDIFLNHGFIWRNLMCALIMVGFKRLATVTKTW